MRTVHRRAAAAAAVLALLLAGCSSSGEVAAPTGVDDPGARTADGAAPAGPVDSGMTTSVSSPGGQLTLTSVSTRAGLVSGGDVLVTVSGPMAAAAAVTGPAGSGTAELGDGGARRVLVSGLPEGETAVTATAGGDSVSLPVTNHPVAGPVFSGPHQEPFVCTTERNGLGPATDEDCAAATKVTWSYVSTGGETKPLEGTAAPDDLATTEVDGRPVPFVVRTEQGVIDRGIAWIWVLDPDRVSTTANPTTAAAAAPDGTDLPGWTGSAWNERLVYRFGGGCGTNFSQGAALGVGLDLDLVGRGYALATNTFDTLQTACNGVLSAEAAAMTREHFVEAYGVPTYTIGDGGSGGAIQQLVIGHAYPGLLDGLAPQLTFPDYLSIAGAVTDCGLLNAYYAGGGVGLTDEQRTAINGHATQGTCAMWQNLFLPAIDPTRGCDPGLAPELVYHPDTNPTGARCTLQDSNVNIAGRDPATGFARRPLDNVGIQYGLEAFRNGTIDAEQFVALNEGVGGYDIDGRIVPTRTEVDEATMADAYRAGLVTGPGPLHDVPIILRNIYTDDQGDIHTRFHLFSVRERLKVDGKDDPNLLLWTEDPGDRSLVEGLTGRSGAGNGPVYVLDEWLTAKDRTTDGSQTDAERLAAAKPASAVNRCVLPDGTVLTGGWELYDQPGPCRDAFPVHSDTRLVAGQPLRNDILKCALEPIDPADYPAPLTPDQLTRLQATFPKGVCDWTKPGVGQQPPTATWPRW